MKSDKAIDPYEQGLRASADMKPSAANPYMSGTAGFEEWSRGHCDGEEDWAKLCEEEVRNGRPHPDAK